MRGVQPVEHEYKHIKVKATIKLFENKELCECLKKDLQGRDTPHWLRMHISMHRSWQ